MKLAWNLIVDRCTEARAALRPDAEASAMLRRALDESTLLYQASWSERLLRRTAWLAAIALVGWIALTLFP